MAKPKKDADRRAVVEQMRREQARKERRRTWLILGSALAVGSVIIGYAVWAAVRQSEQDSAALGSLGVPAAEAGCQDVVTKPAEGSDHLPEGEKISYEAAPPAAGPHWGRYLQGSEIRKLYTVEDRPPVERLVHSLEHGHTILWYDESAAEDDTTMSAVRSISRKFPSSTDPEDKFIAVPWTEADGEPFPEGAHVALTHWSVGAGETAADTVGVWQYCEEVSGEAVEAFMADYPYSDSPEPDLP